MTIPIYDVNTMPCIVLPMKNMQTKTRKYLGNTAVVNDTKTTVKLVTDDNTQMKALFDFWATDCNFGTEPFLLPLPLLGVDYIPDYPDILVKFSKDMSTNINDSVWETSVEVEVMGTIDYVIADNGDFVVSDTGEYTVDAQGTFVKTGNVINDYRNVIRKVVI